MLPMTYAATERARASAWKRGTATLPNSAKVPAPYVRKDGGSPGKDLDFCLPREHAALNLLPDFRDQALTLFAELGIPWHAGVDGGPSNHLLSSQVQCVNALTAMVSEPERIVRAFGSLLGIKDVLPIEPGRYLTFEYIGPKDYFGESPGRDRVRGAGCTSVDAAFLHRASDGLVELVLIEWKYTESYRARRPDPAKDRIRRARYEDAVHDPAGPVRADLLAFEHLLDEPFYQLVRQQLLAHALEQDRAEGADRVRVLHVLPPGNDAYQQSLARSEHRALGATVSEVWQRLLRRPDKFLSVDSSLVLDPSVTSWEYVLRYGDGLILDVPTLLRTYGIGEARELEDVLDFDGDIVVTPEGVELIVGCVGWLLPFPFFVPELHQRIREAEQELQTWDVDPGPEPESGAPG